MKDNVFLAVPMVLNKDPKREMPAAYEHTFTGGKTGLQTQFRFGYKEMEICHQEQVWVISLEDFFKAFRTLYDLLPLAEEPVEVEGAAPVAFNSETGEVEVIDDD